MEKRTNNSNLWTNISILLPFVLVFLGAIFLKVYHPLGTVFKLSAFAYMILYAVFYRKIPKDLLVATIIFIPFLIYGIIISFDIRAGVEDGLRYLFPFATLYYGYAIRKHLNIIVKFMIVFLLINFVAQFINYYYWLQGEEQWFYHVDKGGNSFFNQSMGILRASGIVVYFNVLGYISMISYFVIQRFYKGRFQKILLAVSLILLLMTLSYKTIVSFILVFMIIHYKKLLNLITLGVISAITAMLAFPVQTKELIDNLLYRLNAYILMKTPTVRSETYILMFKDIIDLDWFGHGVGAFGGPASLKYHSPYYEKVHFTWPDTFWMKMTTVDTFPPHVFIELGIIGGLVFFFALISPLIRRYVPKLVLIIYFTLFIDMLFTFSLASLEYLMYSLVLVYPVIYYEQRMRKSSEKL